VFGKCCGYVPKAAPAPEHHLFFGFLRRVAGIVNQTVNLPGDQFQFQATEADRGFPICSGLERCANPADFSVAERRPAVLERVHWAADDRIGIAGAGALGRILSHVELSHGGCP
jgi:hypothetical protein